MNGCTLRNWKFNFLEVLSWDEIFTVCKYNVKKWRGFESKVPDEIILLCMWQSEEKWTLSDAEMIIIIVNIVASYLEKKEHEVDIMELGNLFHFSPFMLILFTVLNASTSRVGRRTSIVSENGVKGISSMVEKIAFRALITHTSFSLLPGISIHSFLYKRKCCQVNRALYF